MCASTVIHEEKIRLANCQVTDASHLSRLPTKEMKLSDVFLNSVSQFQTKVNQI